MREYNVTITVSTMDDEEEKTISYVAEADSLEEAIENIENDLDLF